MEPKRSSQNHIMQYKKRDERKAMLLTKKRGTPGKISRNQQNEEPKNIVKSYCSSKWQL